MLGSQESTPSSGPPRARRDLVLQELGEEGLLYDREGALVHVLNLTALHVWRLCDGTRSIDQIASAIRGAFQVTDGVDVGRDVSRLLGQLSERGLMERG